MAVAKAFQDHLKLLLKYYLFLWFNQFEGTVIYFPKFSNKGIDFLSQIFENGRVI